MRKMNLISMISMILLVLLLVGCEEKNNLTLEDVLISFENEQLPIKEVMYDNPTYYLDGKNVQIKVYDSKSDQQKGLKAHNSLMDVNRSNVIPHVIYEVDNVFIIYNYDDNLNVEYDYKIKSAVRVLSERD